MTDNVIAPVSASRRPESTRLARSSEWRRTARACLTRSRETPAVSTDLSLRPPFALRDGACALAERPRHRLLALRQVVAALVDGAGVDHGWDCPEDFGWAPFANARAIEAMLAPGAETS